MNGIGERLLRVLTVIGGVIGFVAVIFLMLPIGIISFFEWILTGTDYTWKPVTWLMEWTEKALKEA